MKRRRERVIGKGLYMARIVDWNNAEEVELCAELRHAYFAVAKEWVNADPLLKERDRYDSHALHLAVFEEESIIAYMRLLPWHTDMGFMLDHEFRRLLPNDGSELKRRNAVEISRLVVCDGLDEIAKVQAVELLFKLFYQTALQRRYEHFYIVVEPCWLRLCNSRFGFAFQSIGPIHAFPDGTRTVAAYASLRDLETSMQEYSMEKFRWYADLDSQSR